MSKEIRKEVVELSTGKKVTVPFWEEEDVTIGMRRQSRKFEAQPGSTKEETEEAAARAHEEIFWLMLEKALTKEELDQWDDLTVVEAEEATASIKAQEATKK